MNLAVLPIALLGCNDTRDKIEYYDTFKEGEKQETMVWTVRGAAGLPDEFAERVLVALLYLGAQNNFTTKRMEFTTYQILKVLDRTITGCNYKVVEDTLCDRERGKFQVNSSTKLFTTDRTNKAQLGTDETNKKVAPTTDETNTIFGLTNDETNKT